MGGGRAGKCAGGYWVIGYCLCNQCAAKGIEGSYSDVGDRMRDREISESDLASLLSRSFLFLSSLRSLL